MWRGIAWQRVYDWRLLRRWAAGAGTLFMWGLFLFLGRPAEFRQRLGRVLMPTWEIAPVTRTRVVAVSPGDRIVTCGTVLSMGVTLDGESPAEVWLVVAMADGQMKTPCHEAQWRIHGLDRELQVVGGRALLV